MGDDDAVAFRVEGDHVDARPVAHAAYHGDYTAHGSASIVDVITGLSRGQTGLDGSQHGNDVLNGGSGYSVRFVEGSFVDKVLPADPAWRQRDNDLPGACVVAAMGAANASTIRGSSRTGR